MTTGRIKTIAYWTTTLLGPASFVMGGVIQITQSDEAVAMMRHLGYPVYFLTILGVWKLLGAVVTVIPRTPRLKEWAYAGFCFDLTAAAASHAYVGGTASDIIAPLVFLALVLASWALRPASRRLVAAPVPRRVAADVIWSAPMASASR
jgi:uncharacterized membrane protein YphA (DoxX/SURF4 family)